MLVRETVIGSKGLPMESAVRLMRRANEYSCLVALQRGDRSVNAKSLLGILSLAAESGDTVRLIADGADEEEAVRDLLLFFEETHGEKP